MFREALAYPDVILEVTGNFDPPRKSVEAFRDLAQGLLPVDSRPEVDLASEIKDRRLPASGRRLRFGELPNRLCDYSGDVTRELNRTVTRIFGLIRWRRAMLGPVEALYFRGFEGLGGVMTQEIGIRSRLIFNWEHDVLTACRFLRPKRSQT